MSEIPKPPENRSNPELDPFTKDFAGFTENELWNLDDDPNAADLPAETAFTVAPESPQEIDPISHYQVLESFKSVDSNAETKSGHSKLSVLEMVSMFIFVCMLVIGSVLGVIYFSKEIPINSEISKKVSLPVKGKILKISNVVTYWRKPNTQGENPDIVRRGIKLVPVVEIHSEGSSGALRIFFRNEEANLVGDSITIAISGSETHYISATDGFANESMHAAYRTGNSARWQVQAFEGPSIDAPIEQFSPLFETDISTDIR